MKKLSALPTLDDSEWNKINFNGTTLGEYDPFNWTVMDNALIQSKCNIKTREQKLLKYLISLIDIRKPSRKLKVKK